MYKRQVKGIYRGYKGMITDEIEEFKTQNVSNIIQRGGTILKTARCMEFKTPEGRKQAHDKLVEHGIDSLVVIGGDGSLTGARIFADEFNMPIVGLPGTIDNDLYGTDITIGYDTALNTIMELSAFWNNHVMARVEPPLVEKPDAVLESLRRYFGPADKSEPTVDLDRKFVVNLKEILTLKEEKRALDAQVKALETRIKSLYAPIVEEMGTACKGTCEQGGECFKVSYNPLYREGISKDRLSALRAQYPDIYDEFVDQTESRIFKVVKSAIA